MGISGRWWRRRWLLRAAQFVVAMSGKSVTLTRQLSEEHTAGGDEKPRRLTVDDVPSLRMTRKTDRKSSLFENDEYFTPRSLATSLGGLTIAAEKEPKADMVFAAICQALDAGIDDATTCEHGCVAVRNLTVGLDVSVRVCSVRTVAVAIGAADRVVAAMRRHPLNASIAEHGCAALRNLGSGADDLAPRRQQDLVDAGALEVAAEALNRVAATQVKVLEEGAAVIANATAGSGADARKAAAADAGCVDAAVTAMRKVTGGAAAVKGDAAAVAVLEVACTVLLNVCSGAAAEPHPRKEAAIEARACESLAVALGAGATGEPPLALAATCALLTIANGEGAAAGARAQAAVDAGCLAPLAAAMGAHAEIAAMAEVGCKALYALTVGSAERQAAAVAAGCTKAVVGARAKFGAETTARAWADHVLKDCTAKEDAVAAGAKETWLSGWRVK